MKKTLQWKKNIPLFAYKKNRKSWFNFASFLHLLTGLILYLFTKRLFPTVNNNILIIVLNTIHILEDYLENKTSFSIEGIWSKIISCENKLFLENMDNDSLQNFIGDNISFYIGTLIGNYIKNIEYIYRYFSLNKLLFILITYLVLLSMGCHLSKSMNLK